MTLIATTAMGLESVLKQEVLQLGYKIDNVYDGKVEFEGDLTDICKTNIWLRTAGRIYIKIATFKATTFDELFDKTKQINWHNWIGKNDRFPISKITSRKSTLFSKSDCQSIVKKAIVSQLQSHYKIHSLPENEANCAIRIQIENDFVTLSLDSSGAGLNKRGYRAHMDIAPIRETLAAGLILLSRWNPTRDILIDPMCGTGTILIEAGMIAQNIAPGLNRSFASEQWKIIPSKLWNNTRQEAIAAKNNHTNFTILGSDINGRSLNIARKNIELANVTNINVQTLPLSEFNSRHKFGKIITNPPYGDRLNQDINIHDLYTEMGAIFKDNIPDWSYYIITPHEQFEQLFNKKATKRRKLFNGNIQCWYYQYFGPKPPRINHLKT
ncbi:RNA methyltransferase [Candidatus Marinamargulisbacteria bacterium SCGC AG-410-N11]|nr:RNA methyltransferase [Candidatus Marinamargulisbacteria bacterium SCGC AG-410-N11]